MDVWKRVFCLVYNVKASIFEKKQVCLVEGEGGLGSLGAIMLTQKRWDSGLTETYGELIALGG